MRSVMISTIARQIPARKQKDIVFAALPFRPLTAVIKTRPVITEAMVRYILSVVRYGAKDQNALTPARTKKPQRKKVDNLSKRNSEIPPLALKMSAETAPTGKITENDRGT